MPPSHIPLRFKDQWQPSPQPGRKLRIGNVEKPVAIFSYLLVVAMFGGAGIYILRDHRTGWLLVLALIFFAIAAVPIVMAVHRMLGRIRYGEVMLEMDGPAVIGEAFSARLMSPGGAGGARSVEARLSCKKVWSNRIHPARMEQKLTEGVLWSTSGAFPTTYETNRAVWNLTFQLPANQPASRGNLASMQVAEGVYWDLQVHAGDVDGVDLKRGFTIPVVSNK